MENKEIIGFLDKRISACKFSADIFRDNKRHINAAIAEASEASYNDVKKYIEAINKADDLAKNLIFE